MIYIIFFLRLCYTVDMLSQLLTDHLPIGVLMVLSDVHAIDTKPSHWHIYNISHRQVLKKLRARGYLTWVWYQCSYECAFLSWNQWLRKGKSKMQVVPQSCGLIFFNYFSHPTLDVDVSSFRIPCYNGIMRSHAFKPVQHLR